MRFLWISLFAVAGVVACGARIEGDGQKGNGTDACPSNLSMSCRKGAFCKTTMIDCNGNDVEKTCWCWSGGFWDCGGYDAGCYKPPPPGNDDCLLAAKQGAYCSKPNLTCPFNNNCGVIGSCTCIGTKWDCPSCPMKLDAGTD